MNISTIDATEVAKFAQLSNDWWNVNGPLKTLHDINPSRLKFISNHVNLKDKVVLDIGCGGGILSEAMTKEGAIVTGLDVDLQGIATAKQHAESQKLTINYICQPVEEYRSGESGLFDIITCMEMLEHVNEPRLVIEQARRLLKPDGILFLSTINRTLQAYLGAIIVAEYVLNLLPRQTHDYHKLIKPSELAFMLRTEKLEITTISGLSYNPIQRTASLTPSVSINYLVAASRAFSA